MGCWQQPGGPARPFCLCGAGHPLRPSLGPEAPKSGIRRPLRAGGPRPKGGGKLPCSLPGVWGAGLGRGEAPSGPGAARPDFPGGRVCAHGRRPWPRRGQWPACALTADSPWAHGRRLPPEDVRAVIGHRTSFQHLRQQVPGERRGMREPCQGGGPAGGRTRGQWGVDGRTPPPRPRAGPPAAPATGGLSPGGPDQTLREVHGETSFNPGYPPVMLKT